MKKIITLGIMLLFLGMTISSSGFNLEKQSTVTTLGGNTLYVGGGGAGNYSTIQSAINEASSGDTIFVYNGTYNEYELDVNKSIKLIGEDKYATIIDGQGKNYVMDFQANWITLSGFTIQNAEEGASVSIIIVSNHWGPETNHNTITNNIFNDSSMNAIFMYSTNHNIVTNNIVMNCGLYLNCGFGIECGAPHRENIIANNTVIGSSIDVWGAPKNDIISNNRVIDSWIGLDGGNNNTVEKNIIENGTRLLIDDTTNNVVKNNVLISSEAIVIRESTKIMVYNNTFIDSYGILIYGDRVDYWDTHTIVNNEINGKQIYYYSRKQGITPPSNATQVILANSNNCYIENFTFNLGWGIQIGFSSNNMICNNEIINSFESGILLQNSSQNLILKNILKDNTKNGIEFRGKIINNNVSKNIITNNSENGIEFRGMSIDNNISKNIITNNSEDGIFLSEDSSDNKIYQNIIKFNQDDGIRVAGKSNSFFNNIIEGNNDSGFICTGLFNSIYDNHISNNSWGVRLSLAGFTNITRNNLINNSNKNVYFTANYRVEFSNKWKNNYYDNINIGVKIIKGRIQTRFGYWSGFDPRIWYWFYRPGFNFDWHPASEPYDIGV